MNFVFFFFKFWRPQIRFEDLRFGGRLKKSDLDLHLTPPMSAQLHTTLHAIRVVYPAMALILIYEMSTKIFKTPLISATAESYGQDAPLVNGAVAVA